MATTPTDVTVLYEIKFSQLFEQLVQQQDVRIANTFRQGNYRGSKGAQVIKQIGPGSVRQRTVRFEPVVFSDVNHDARWVYPIPYHDEVGFDTWDELMTTADPRSGYADRARMAMNRQKDFDALIAFFADAKTGEQGGSTTTFPTSTQQVAVTFGASAATHLTLAKIKEGKRILMANEVDLDMEEIYCSARAIDIDSLMSEVTVTSQDFQAGTGLAGAGAPVLRDGKLARVFGVNIIHSEQHQVSGANTLLAMWVNSAMSMGTWEDPKIKIDQRVDLVNNPWQLSINAMFGFTRLQEKKVVQILSVTA